MADLATLTPSGWLAVDPTPGMFDPFYEFAPLPALSALVSWTGNGAASRTISGVGFTGTFVIVKSSGGNCFFWHEYTWRGASPLLSSADPHLTDAVTGWTRDGFTVGINANGAGVTYYAMVVADNGSNSVGVGSYAGNGVDNREIVTNIANPALVLVKRDNFFPAWLRHLDMTTSYPMTAAAAANNIKSLTAAGFTVGTANDINEASLGAGSGGEAYDYIALGAGEITSLRRFVGTGVARTLPLTTAAPIFALTKSLETATPRAARVALGNMPTASDASISGALTTGVTSVTDGVYALGTSAEANNSGQSVFVAGMQNGSGNRKRLRERTLLVPAVRFGASGGAIVGVGVNGNAAFSFVGSAFSVEFVFSTANANASNAFLVSRAQSATAGQLGWTIYLSGANKALLMQFGVAAATTVTLEAGLRFQANQTYHAVFTWNGSNTWTWYIDGQQAKTGVVSVTMVDVATPANGKVAIGAIRGASDIRANSAAGDAIALVRLYNVALTKAQATARYRRARLGDLSAAETPALEEWDAANVAGTVWTPSYDGQTANIGTLAAGDTVVTI